jgi:hypothetical protein
LNENDKKHLRVQIFHRQQKVKVEKLSKCLPFVFIGFLDEKIDEQQLVTLMRLSHPRFQDQIKSFSSIFQK